MTLAHHLGRDQAADAGGKMHHEAAGEIQHAHGGEEAAAPDPVRQRHIDEHEPADGKQQVGREPHAIGHRARHQRDRDDRKRHLVKHEQRFRNRLRRRIDVVHLHAGEKPAVERAEPGPVADERQRVAERYPENRNQRHGGEALRHRRQHVLLAHHAGIEQREARDRHHQHQRGGCDHPGGVGGVDAGGFGQSRRHQRCER